MAAKAILVICAQALLIQFAFSQCFGLADITAPYGLAGRGWGYDGLAYDGLGLAGRGWAGCGPAINITATIGGGLPVTSGSAIPPVGISVASENAFEGILAAAGELPFVGTIRVESVLPTAGAGGINYGCGNVITAMASDILAPGIAAPGIGALAPAIGAIAPAAAIAPATAIAFSALGYGAGWASRGCGCGL